MHECRVRRLLSAPVISTIVDVAATTGQAATSESVGVVGSQMLGGGLAALSKSWPSDRAADRWPLSCSVAPAASPPHEATSVRFLPCRRRSTSLTTLTLLGPMHSLLTGTTDCHSSQDAMLWEGTPVQ